MRRGGVLLEVLLSIALFVGAGAFALHAMRTTFDNIDRARRDQFAVDLARSKMAELEAGLISIADMRSEIIREAGSRVLVEDDIQTATTGAISRGWSCEVQTQRTEYRDLTLIVLTVREDRAAEFTLRQLVKLREFDPEEYEADDLLQGLPPGGGQ